MAVWGQSDLSQWATVPTTLRYALILGQLYSFMLPASPLTLEFAAAAACK